VDDFTRELATAALKDLKQDRRGHSVQVPALLSRMEMLYCQWRDLVIEALANHMLDSEPEPRLAELVDPVWDRLADRGEYWETPAEDMAASWVAWGLAVLGWMDMVADGQVQTIACTRDELIAWLAEQQPVQMALLEV
jgi:hypothetical protein